MEILQNPVKPSKDRSNFISVFDYGFRWWTSKNHRLVGASASTTDRASVSVSA